MSRTKEILISGGMVIDPSQAINRVTDVVVEGEHIKSVGKASAKGAEVIDASGMVVAPGLIDMHVHLREPGSLDKETIRSGLRSAVAGGFASVACMANTEPPIDTEAAVEFVLLQARRAGLANLFPVGSATKQRQGREISEMEDMVRAGAIAFSDDGNHVADAGLMRKVLEYANTLDRPVLSHCEDKNLSGDGVMHEGIVSAALRLSGMAAAAEETAAARDISLAGMTGARLHIMHVSTAGTVNLVREAKARGVRVTAEATAHHFTLTDEDVRDCDTNFKMNPPLRSRSDVEAVREAIADGTIDCIVSDHAPHTAGEKEADFTEAPFGVIGLESLLPVTLTELVHTEIIPLGRAVECLTAGPARVLGIERGTLAPGAAADITIFDPGEKWTLDASAFESRSRNCPFDGKKVNGRVKYVLVGGRVMYPFAD